MKKLITFLLLLILKTGNLLSQPTHIDLAENLKISKWAATWHFTDSSLNDLKEMNFVRIKSADTAVSRPYPVIWIENNEFKINYLINGSYKIVSYKYIYDPENMLLITLINNDPGKTPMTFKASFISTRSAMSLFRQNK
ncbi:MAG: hypothetical protein H7321_06815 [Bacteroidia bacterium]|nr:hypothetical protein [Bacteroidia bacterium]